MLPDEIINIITEYADIKCEWCKKRLTLNNNFKYQSSMYYCSENCYAEYSHAVIINIAYL